MISPPFVDDVSILPEDERPSPEPLPPLRIHHIMLWTAVTAVLLTIVRSVSDFSEGVPFRLNAAGGAMVVVAAAIVSASLTVAGLLWSWHRKGHLINEPGQWLAIDVALRSVLMGAAALIAASLDGSQFTGPMIYVGVMCLGFLATGVFQIRVGMWFASLWKYVFICKAVVLFLYLGTQVTPMLFGISLYFVLTIPLSGSYPILIVLQFAAMRSDRKHCLKRHWTHSVGLLIHLLINFVFAGLMLMSIAALWI
jgi:hypothetical protein